MKIARAAIFNWSGCIEASMNDRIRRQPPDLEPTGQGPARCIGLYDCRLTVRSPGHLLPGGKGARGPAVRSPASY